MYASAAGDNFFSFSHIKCHFDFIGNPRAGIIFKSPVDNSLRMPMRGITELPSPAITACITQH